MTIFTDLDNHKVISFQYDNVITHLSHYVSARNTVNLLLLNGSGFFCELHRPYYRECFHANNKKNMQARKFFTANDLHYTVLSMVKRSQV